LNVRRGVRGIPAYSLPHRARVYINNQVLLPANLVRSLNLQNVAQVDIRLKYKDEEVELKNVKLLRTRHTDSRQFTIPKGVRMRLGIKPGDEVEILDVRPSESS